MPLSNHLSNRFWALQPETAEAVFEELARAARPGSDTASPLPRAAFNSPVERNKGYEVQNGVAVIPVSGTITRKAVYGWWSGSPITQGQDAIASALSAALADPTVSAIMLDVNSPGGTVPGTKELADAIAIAAAKKPMAAYADGLMASAAMWLSAATGRVYAPVTATVGSVGVVMVHTDWSKLNERWGISFSYITGGKYKAAGNPDNPLNDEARALFQKQVAEIHEIFKADVSRGLKITAPAEQWAEGQTMLADEGKACGLVTAIVRDLNSAITLLRQEANMDLKTFAAQHPELLAEIQNQARADAEQALQGKVDEAAKAATESALAVVKAVAGDEAHATVSGLIEAGISTPAQVAALSGLLAKAARPEKLPETPAAKEEAARADILNALHKVTPAAMAGGAPEGGDEVETRAAIERMSKM